MTLRHGDMPCPFAHIFWGTIGSNQEVIVWAKPAGGAKQPLTSGTPTVQGAESAVADHAKTQHNSVALCTLDAHRATLIR